MANDDSGEEGGDSLAGLLIGVGPPGNGGGGCTPCQVGFVNAVSTQSFRYGVFAQDNYRFSPKLTLNLGLRYELSIPRTERFNRMNWLDPNVVSPLQVPGLPTLHGGEIFASSNDRSNYYIDYKAIQPRFGFAYQWRDGFVFRGGYGIYFSTPRSGAAGTGPWGYQGFDVQPPWITTFNCDHARSLGQHLGRVDELAAAAEHSTERRPQALVEREHHVVGGFRQRSHRHVEGDEGGAAAASYKDISLTIEGRMITLRNGLSEIEAAPGSASRIVKRTTQRYRHRCCWSDPPSQSKHTVRAGVELRISDQLAEEGSAGCKLRG